MKQFKVTIILALLLFSCSFAENSKQNNLLKNGTFSTSVEKKDDKKLAREKKKAERKAKKQKRIEEGKLLVTPYLAPGYTPEMGAVIALGGLFSWKTNPKDTLIQRSSLPVNVSFMSTGGILVNAILTSYWLQDKLRIDMDLWYKNMPDNYWGIGYENGKNVEKSDTTTAYNREWWWANPRFFWQPIPNLFFGYEVNYTYTHGTEATQKVKDDENYKKFNDRPLNSGMGLNFRFDTRDIPVDAHKGVLLNLRTLFYSTAFGGDNKYQEYSLDYRQYYSFSPNDVLAWQVKSRFTFGEVPYGEMSQIGTPFDLRGYTWGQFRDYHMGFILVEYRKTFNRKNGEKSPHGIVTWFGSGSVFDSDDIESNNINSLPNFGIGYRLEIQPRMHFRIDLGMGKETSGLYFNFNQAF